MNFIQADGFRWFECPFVLRRETGNSIEFLSLKPQVELFYDNGDKQAVQVDIKMQRTLNVDDDLGYTWHKSWIIPEIHIKIKDFESNQFNSNDLSCEITTGFPVKKHDTYFIHEVKLEGEAFKSMHNYEVRFNNLKFTTTSFNTEGRKFSLVLVVFLNQGGHKKLLKSFISVPVYIDSRKEARVKKETIIRLQDTFPVDKFTEVIVFKKKADEIVIENDFHSFLEYYQCNNHMNRIKHPFFLCYRFSTCFTLYYNAKEIRKSELTMYYVLLAIYEEKLDSVLIFTPFISNNYRKKTTSIFDSWQLDFTKIVFSRDEVPSHYEAIPAESLYNAYKQYYRKFSKMCNIRKNAGGVEGEDETVRCQIVLQKGGIAIEAVENGVTEKPLKIEEGSQNNSDQT